MSKLIRKSLKDGQVLTRLKKEMELLRCTECAETPKLFQKPMLTLTSERAPNIVVSPNFLLQKMHNMAVDILVMIDHGDMFLKLKLFQNRTTLTAFNAFYNG